MSGDETKRGRATATKRLEDVAMIDPGPQPQAVWPVLTKVWAGISTWKPYRGSHKPCDIHVMVIHEQGVATAPPVAPATMYRDGPNGRNFVCGAHAVEWQQRDREARETRDRRIREAAERHPHARRSW
jgi:hypothetical protein